MPRFFTYNLVAQCKTSSYKHKLTFGNKLKLRNLVSKPVLFLRSLVNCRIFKKIWKIIFLIEHNQVTFVYSYKRPLQWSTNRMQCLEAHYFHGASTGKQFCQLTVGLIETLS